MAADSGAPSWRWEDDTHKLPIKADIRTAIGKEAGDTVTITLEERL